MNALITVLYDWPRIVTGWLAWLPPLAWRLDAHYKRLYKDLPHLSRLPSEVIHDHVWLTTQPMEEPDRPEHFLELLEQGNLYDRLMFATDYPHLHTDDLARVLSVMPESMRPKVMHSSARQWYRLDKALGQPTP